MSKNILFPEFLQDHKPATRRVLKTAIVRRSRRTAELELRRAIADLTAEDDTFDGQVGPTCRLCGRPAEDCDC